MTYPAPATRSSRRSARCWRARADLASAVRIANLAAGIVVGKLGTAVVHPDELTQ